MRILRGLAPAAFVLTLGCPGTETPPAPKRWTTLTNTLDRVPLCVWGSAPNDAYLGGGGLGSGRPTLLLHDDGKVLTEIATGRTETIWWLHGSSANDVWAVGEQGLALHSDGTTFNAVPTGTTATLYGVWAAAPNDAWAVGGSPGGGGPNDVLLHYDGAAWSAVPAPSPNGESYFKVWGRAANDVFVVGQGVALHYDGLAWKKVSVPTSTMLLTVNGGAQGVFAIGGPPPTLLRWDGQAFVSVPTPFEMSGIMSGVAVGPETIFVVGERHQRYRFDGVSTFVDDGIEGDSWADLHAVWADRDGNALAVGGNYMSLGATIPPRGTVLRYGP